VDGVLDSDESCGQESFKVTFRSSKGAKSSASVQCCAVECHFSPSPSETLTIPKARSITPAG